MNGTAMDFEKVCLTPLVVYWCSAVADQTHIHTVGGDVISKWINLPTPWRGSLVFLPLWATLQRQRPETTANSLFTQSIGELERGTRARPLHPNVPLFLKAKIHRLKKVDSQKSICMLSVLLFKLQKMLNEYGGSESVSSPLCMTALYREIVLERTKTSHPCKQTRPRLDKEELNLHYA